MYHIGIHGFEKSIYACINSTIDLENMILNIKNNPTDIDKKDVEKMYVLFQYCGLIPPKPKIWP